MNKHNNLIIFCQAPADVPYVLNIIRERKEKQNIFLYIINVEGLFTFFKLLNIKLTRLEFVPYLLFDIKNMLGVFNEKLRIKKIWNGHFAKLSKEGCDVYFFSRFEDWLTSSFIVRFAQDKNSKVVYYNHYDHSAALFKRRKENKLRQLIVNSVFKYMTSASFKTEIKEKVPELKTENYPISEVKAEIDVRIFRDYAINIFSAAKERPRLLLFISPCEKTIFDCTRYDEILLGIINLFHSLGYEIAAKGHPRMGMPEKIREFIHHEIPSYIPGEFIDHGEFDLCLGIYSSVICHFAVHTDLPVYSVIELFAPSDIGFYTSAKNYLELQSQRKLNLISSETDLVTIAKTYKKANEK